MRKNLSAAIALAALAITPALGADLPRGASPYGIAPVGVFNWSGPYVGANLGYQWATITNLSPQPTGVMGGIQGGYNWQTGQFVVGGEADFQFSAADDTVGALKFSNPWFGTIRGRGGLAFNNVLLYLTAGFAYGEGSAQTAGLTETHTHAGLAGGGGIEVALTPAWSVKAEYLYINLTDQSYILTGRSNAIDSNILRVGANYRF